MKISVVVPTFNRGVKLRDTLTSILANDVQDFHQVELIVVDDGSDSPISNLVDALCGEPPWRIRHLRQSNKGPAAARNAGFRASGGSIVVFIDDDILTPPDLISRHVQAHHARPNSVICGRCLLKADAETPLQRFLDSLGNDPGRDATEDFLETPIVASGQISVERSLFQDLGVVYREDLSVPGAEEFELSYRLTKARVPIFVATRIAAIHDQPTALEAICRQQYKHGLGLAEFAATCPPLLQREAFADMLNPLLESSSRLSPLQQPRELIINVLTRRRLRLTLVEIVTLMERYVPLPTLLHPAYQVVIGAHWLAGIRDGKRIYATL